MDLILVKGTIPGSKGRWILVKDAIKKELPSEAPIPGAFRKLDPYTIVEPAPKQEEPVESTEATVSDSAEHQNESTTTKATGEDSSKSEAKKQNVESDEKKASDPKQSVDEKQESVTDESKQDAQETAESKVEEQSSADSGSQESTATSIERYERICN